MELPPFLLDRWIEQKQSPNSPIEYDLASSTGPVWRLRELLALSGADKLETLLDTHVSYTTAIGNLELRAAIARLSGVEAEDVQVTTGASEALLILFFLAAEPGANVVLPNPGFPRTERWQSPWGLKSVYYELRAENQFRVDLDEISKLVDRQTRLLLVNSPHNPTGAVLSNAEMQTCMTSVPSAGFNCLRRVYHPIYHGPEIQSAARLSHATVISDFSKALCLSGLRVGWMIDRDPARRERYLNARNHFTVTGNVFGEQLAALALEHSDKIYAHARNVAQKNLALLDQVLTEHDGFLQWLRPAGGMTAFPWLTNGTETREFCRRLAKRGVLIVPGDCFGQPKHFRLGFAASGDRFPLAMERFAEFLHAESRQGSAAYAG